MDDVEVIGARAESPLEAPVRERGRLLKRRETARELGVSESTVRRMEGAVLTPVVGADGVHRFREEQVRELTIRRVHVGPPDPAAYDGAIAAEVFALFDEGLTPVQVVKRTEHDPRVVAALRQQYAALQGGFVVTATDISELEALPWLVGSFPINTSAQLIHNLKSSSPDACVVCKAHEPRVCSHCAKRLALKRAASLSLSDTKRDARVGEQKIRSRSDREASSRTERRTEDAADSHDCNHADG